MFWYICYTCRMEECNVVMHHALLYLHGILLPTMNVNKKLGKLIDVAQPEPPTTEKFIYALWKKNQQEDKEACDNAITSTQRGGVPFGKETQGNIESKERWSEGGPRI